MHNISSAKWSFDGPFCLQVAVRHVVFSLKSKGQSMESIEGVVLAINNQYEVWGTAMGFGAGKRWKKPFCPLSPFVYAARFKFVLLV